MYTPARGRRKNFWRVGPAARH